MVSFIVIVVMLFSYIDADVGNLRKFEYIKVFLGIS